MLKINKVDELNSRLENGKREADLPEELPYKKSLSINMNTIMIIVPFIILIITVISYVGHELEYLKFAKGNSSNVVGDYKLKDKNIEIMRMPNGDIVTRDK